MNKVDQALRRQISTVPKAISALVAMERQLTTARTYDQIKRVIKEATAIKLLAGHVAEVKAQAEDTILLANRRIAEELRKIPKAKSGRKSKEVPHEEPKAGRAATGVAKATRSRLSKLADLSVQQIKAQSQALRDAGKDATVTAVIREITQGDKKTSRSRREAVLASKIMALPERKFGVIYADPPWRFEPYSRESGLDRSADNHYPTMSLDDIKALNVPAADDCVLFLWATVPMLRDALIVMKSWNFEYKSHCIWDKEAPGTGYWFRNQHELLLVGVRGAIPAPAPGTQLASVQSFPAGVHSEKPAAFASMIEGLFPNLPKLEMFARHTRPGWSSWGNEIDQPASAAQ